MLYKITPVLRGNSTNYFQETANYIINNTAKDSKIFILSQDTSHMGIQLYINYYINPRRTNFDYYNLPINCTDCESKYNIKKYLLIYNYFYIYNSTSNIHEKYPYLKDLKLKQLYKIKNINGIIEFEEI